MNAQSMMRTLLEADNTLNFRDGQTRMASFIENKMGQSSDNLQSKVCVIEGQTGCGKSLGYLIPTIPAVINAKDSDNPLKLVISTANVALQQQLIDSELPRFKQAGVKLKTALAAGRGRYVCLEKINHLASETVEVSQMRKVEMMTDAFFKSTWDGLKDTLPENQSCDEHTWSSIKADSVNCTKSECPHYEYCPFFKARNQLKHADIIVANHALVLSDLEHNRVLPEPESTIYVFDEAHHLPEMMRNNSKLTLGLFSAIESLQQRGPFISQISMLNEMTKEKQSFSAHSLENALASAHEAMRELYATCKAQFAGRQLQQKESIIELTFSALPESLIQLIQTNIIKPLNKVIKVSDQVLENTRESLISENIELSLYAQTFSKFHRLNNILTTCLAFIDQDKEPGQVAKWLKLTQENAEVSICTGRVDVSTMFVKHLWEKHAFTVLTSATLTALGKFDRFMGKVGLSNKNIDTLEVKSPFDFYNNGQISIHRSMPIPNWRDEQQHTDAILRQLFEDFSLHQAGLLLFTSKRQLITFTDMLTPEQESICLIQYSDTRNNLIRRHKERIDRGERSLLIGVQSLSEGLDLPKHYLTFVALSKIPFVDASCPISKAEIQMCENNKGNAFNDIILADASAKLTQATGRLLRTIDCNGKISIYDQRLVTKPYGKTLIEALPNYEVLTA